ncbi:competence type IV pilus minor pilin ComGF [uncultured Enterococcus sp.]|uniref:competence type IV pilus minor pilin ComGF n=1 Tax=uncultured Enterococcus sp. TaxID=167972 RepID=UPI002AA89EA0|nr:competence type IV pilus minor pilin ComGF [uncultured Enterococcus sp.]
MKRLFFPSSADDKRSRFIGFTLLECLLSLFLFSVICLLGSGYIKNVQVLSRHLQNTSEKEWHIFLIQLENELEGCEFVSVESDSLTFYDSIREYTVRIEHKKQKIIKTANGGYQPMLTKVDSAVFKQTDRKIELQLHFEDGQYREALLSI